MAASFVSVFVSSLLYPPGLSRVLMIVDMGLFAAAMITTTRGNVPINLKVMALRPGVVSENWFELVRTWGRYDQLRLVLFLVAFIFALVALGVSRPI
jgi:hypothetical protein